jgi:Ca-activated chloride channel family protein
VPVLSLRFVILLVGMLAAPTALTIVETGSIAGHVRDPQGKPIKSAMVDVVGTSLSTITNDSGYYVFPNVPVEAYTVRARVIGFSLSQPITVRVTANATAVADLTVTPSPATLEAVVVTGVYGARAANGVVRIRGATAATSRADALYVVDGYGGAYDSTEAWRYQRHPGNREQYDEIVENQFIAVAADPLSTFSIDVDRASYSNMRRFILQDGQLPPRDAVRIEELVN